MVGSNFPLAAQRAQVEGQAHNLIKSWREIYREDNHSNMLSLAGQLEGRQDKNYFMGERREEY